MLINCPKCGFSQPQDQYCANCGVDMVNFRPSAPPAWKTAMAHPGTHIALLTVLVFGSIFFIRQKNREELRSRVALLKGGPVLVERGFEKEEILASEDSQEIEMATDMATETPPEGIEPEAKVVATRGWSANAAAPSAAGASATENAPAPRGTASPAGFVESAKTQNLKLTVTYAEVDMATLNSWIAESRTLGQLRTFDGVTMGTLNSIRQKLEQTKTLKVLQKMDRTFEGQNLSSEWFTGTHTSADLENDTGFFASVALLEPQPGGLRGDIEVQRAIKDFKEPSKPVERTSFGSSFEMTPQSGYFMAGLMPRRSLGLEDETQIDPALNILKSRSFMDRQTEFTLIFAFDTPTASER